MNQRCLLMQLGHALSQAAAFLLIYVQDSHPSSSFLIGKNEKRRSTGVNLYDINSKTFLRFPHPCEVAWPVVNCCGRKLISNAILHVRGNCDLC